MGKGRLDGAMSLLADHGGLPAQDRLNIFRFRAPLAKFRAPDLHSTLRKLVISM